MKPLNRREKLLTTAVVVALVFTLAKVSVLDPQKRRLKQARAELTAGNQQLTTLYTKLAGLKNLRQEVVYEERQLAAAAENLSFQGELAQVLHQLTTEARNQGLSLQYLRPGQSEILTTPDGTPVDFRRSIIEFGMRCRYQELGEFLSALEKQSFFLEVAGMQLGHEEAQPPYLEVQLDVAIVVRSGKQESI